MKIIDFIKQAFLPLTMFFCVIAVYSQSEFILASKDYSANKDWVWNDFREKYPYQYQMVGLAEYDDNSKILIISEPPSHVSEPEIRKIFEGYDINLTIKRQPIGFDGWIKDIVLHVNNVDEKRFENTLKELQQYLYHTDYKAYTIPLPIQSKSENFSGDNLNLQVSAAELQKWFITDNEILISSNKVETNLNNCFYHSNSVGIYFSKKTGFVVWIVDILNDLKDSKIDARKFTLDTDLILGAISRGKYVAIIGRERQNPVNLMPPLRVETIMRLAATEHAELSQSYERNSLFAGQIFDEKNERKDWAPILLSEELWHTEYGQLLNVTDQILKSWSENGNIEYEAFNYEKPIEWSFDTSAMKDLQVNHLTYNWNTSGVGYSVLMENKDEIYAINRTGSLPVSYIPDGQEEDITKENKVYQAEEMAYDWFSNLNNPDLVRVVQYASLFQIFQNYYVRYSGNYERARYNLELLNPDLNTFDLISFTKSEIEKYINEDSEWKYSLFSDLSKYDYKEKSLPFYKKPNIQSSFEETEKTKQKYKTNSEGLEKDAYSLLLDIANYDVIKEEILWNYYFEDRMNNFQYYLLIDSTHNYIKEVTETEYFQCIAPYLDTISIDKLLDAEEPINALDKKEYKAIYNSLKKYFKENEIKRTSEKNKLIDFAIQIFLANKDYELMEIFYELETKSELDSLQIFTTLDSLQKLFKSYQTIKLSTDKNLLELVAKLSVNRDAIDFSMYNENERLQILNAAQISWEDIQYIQEYSEILNIYPLLSVRDRYLKANEYDFSIWVKCPTIVQSWDTRESYGIGGHNLSAKITPYKIDKTIKAGTYKVKKLADGSKIVYLGEADINKITPNLLREIERTNFNGTNNFSKTSTKVMSRNEVISGEIPKNPNQRGFVAENHIVIKQNSQVFEVIQGNKKIILKDYEQVNSYLVKENRSAKVIFEDYSMNEVKATINSADISQTAYFKRTNMPEFQVDYSNPFYRIISNNQIEVTLPYVGKKISHTKISFKNMTIEKVKSFISKLGSGEKTKSIYKEINIQRNDIKQFIILEFENGIISDNFNHHERFYKRIGLSTNAA